jgi:hypothetical protein
MRAAMSPDPPTTIWNVEWKDAVGAARPRALELDLQRVDRRQYDVNESVFLRRSPRRFRSYLGAARQSQCSSTRLPSIVDARQENISSHNDAYSRAFFPHCNHLLSKAVAAAGEGRQASASQLFLRVACLYRVSRSCSTNPSLRWKAFEAQKAAYALGTSSWTDPVCEVLVPHTRREEQDDCEIPLYIRLPTTPRQAPIATTILLTGADQCRADYSWALHECLRKGSGCVILETPGSGDSPADLTIPRACLDSGKAYLHGCKSRVFSTWTG